ncbi:glycosyltransferase family 39 protein [Streptomyces sp. UNOC14_S4]|nr:glycosyltransferase family 39 protein [Streptomyces sp. UNOC14_S4]MCC3768205.1 glycosyltransferase family 39 protein [Streptomyces sp. UNOC14_S4]
MATEAIEAIEAIKTIEPIEKGLLMSPSASPARGRTALIIAVALTAVAAVQQILLLFGLGNWLPGWQPWPYLLGAAVAWLVARPRWEHAGDPSADSSADPSADSSAVASTAASACSSAWLRGVDALRRVPPWVFLAAVLGLAAGVWAFLQDEEPHIGHEEAVYANKARSWSDGTPAAGWGIYRPVGLPALGRVALFLHDDVGALRGVALALVLFTLTTTYLLAARWTTPRRAAIATLLVLGGLGFLRRVPEFLNDIGSTGFLLIVVHLLVRAQEKPGSRALLILPVPVLAAFYLRYGVVGNLLAIAAAALVCYGPRAWLAQGRRLAVAGAFLVIGLVPHFVHSTEVSGSPLGVIMSATSQSNRSYIGEGLVYYLAIFPYRLAGDLGAVVMAAGLLAAGAAARRILRSQRSQRSQRGHRSDRSDRSDRSHRAESAGVRPDDRRRTFLGCTALLVFVLLGITTHGEPRFVYLPVVLLTILGVQALAEFTGRWASRVLSAVAALAAVTVLGTAQVVAHGAMPAPDRLSDSVVPVAKQLSSDGPCLLVTGYEPEVGWYSGCDAVTYAQYRTMDVPAGTEVSLILFERGRLQPGKAALKRLIGDRRTTVREIPTDGSIGRATVITLPP